MRLLTPEPSPEQLVLDRETAATAVRRLSRLPERQREALLLRSAGFGINEIARELDVSYKTAESLLSRARAFMRKTVVLGGAILVAVLRGLRRNTKSAPVLAAAIFALALGTGSSITRPAPVAPGATHGPALAVKVLGRSASSSAPRLAHRTPRTSSSRSLVGEQTGGPPPRIALVKPTRIRSGPAHAQTPGVSYGHTDETILQTTDRCLREGVRVSPSQIGCPH
jgi:DNA-binding CsgD family transcriptional regulator